MALNIRDDHMEDITIFRKTVDVEKALKKQVVAAIDKLYIKELRDLQTYTIIMIVAELLTRLFASSGLVDATKISKEEQKFALMVCNLNDPPVIVYNSAGELVALAKAGTVPKTQSQIVNIGVEMIRKTQDFEIVLSEWFKHPAVDHTWKVFKSHITAAHNTSKLICGPRLCNTAYHQAN